MKPFLITLLFVTILCGQSSDSLFQQHLSSRLEDHFQTDIIYDSEDVVFLLPEAIDLLSHSIETASDEDLDKAIRLFYHTNQRVDDTVSNELILTALVTAGEIITNYPSLVDITDRYFTRNQSSAGYPDYTVYQKLLIYVPEEYNWLVTMMLVTIFNSSTVEKPTDHNEYNSAIDRDKLYAFINLIEKLADLSVYSVEVQYTEYERLEPIYFTPWSFMYDNENGETIFDKQPELLRYFANEIDSVLSVGNYDTTLVITDSLFETLLSFKSRYFNEQYDYYGAVQYGDTLVEWKALATLTARLEVGIESSCEDYLYTNLTIGSPNQKLLMVAGFPGRYSYGQLYRDGRQVLSVWSDSIISDSLVRNYREASDIEIHEIVYAVPTSDSSYGMVELFQINDRINGNSEQSLKNSLYAVFARGDTVLIEQVIAPSCGENAEAATMKDVIVADVNGDQLLDIIISGPLGSRYLYIQQFDRTFLKIELVRGGCGIIC